MEESLFALIRIGLDTEQPSEYVLSAVATLKGKQWRMLKEIAQKQGVSAVVLDGINNLCVAYGQERVCASTSLERWKDFVAEWSGDMIVTEQANLQQQEVMSDLAAAWMAKGCRVMLMKGQANGTFYPKPEHRSPGDIDCYLFENYSRGNEIAREAGALVDESWYKHSQIHYKGELFENHQYFVHTRDGKRGKSLEKELEAALNVPEKEFSILNSQCLILMPPVQWNAMFLTYHACAHFVSEGLRLKQILDWAMFLKTHQNDVDWPQFYAFCERHHLKRFVDAMTDIAVKYLGVNVTQEAQIATGSPYTDKILHSALYDEDYVFGSGEGSWHNRWHLIRNLFHYRWKYEEIYQTSVWKQLWWYATGFLFKTE